MVILVIGVAIIVAYVVRQKKLEKEEKEYMERHSGKLPGVDSDGGNASGGDDDSGDAQAAGDKVEKGEESKAKKMQEKIAARIAEKLAKKKAKAEAEQAAKKASAAEAKAMNKKKTLAYLKSLKVIKGNAGVSSQFDKPTGRPDRPTSVPSSGPSTASEEFNSFEEDIEYPKPPVRRNKKNLREDIYNL